MQVFVVADAVWPASQSVHTADEPPAGIGADELGIVVIPGIRNCGTVRHNEDALRLAIPSHGQTLAQVIRSQGLAKTRLRVPQEFTLLVQLEVIQCLANRSLLLGAQLIVGGSETVKNSMILAELMEPTLRIRGLISNHSVPG